VDAQRFWSIVDDSRAQAAARGGDSVVEQHVATLAQALQTLPDDDVLAFDRQLRAIRAGANRWDLWAAAYLALGGCGDDSFLDFRTWLISHGRDIFERVLADPDALAELSWDEEEDDFGFAEEWGYVPGEVLENRGAEPDDADGEDDDGPTEADDPTGEPFPEDDNAWFAARFPRLWAKYGGSED
jgi:hypothetical protein